MVSFGGYLLDFEASLSNQLGSTARSKKPNIILNQTLGEIEETSLVVHGQDSFSRSVPREKFGLSGCTHLFFDWPWRGTTAGVWKYEDFECDRKPTCGLTIVYDGYGSQSEHQSTVKLCPFCCLFNLAPSSRR